MLIYPNIDPVAIAVGPVQIHWYGVSYLFGFIAAWWFGRLRAKREDAPLAPEQIEDLIFYGAMGVVLGGRLGYVLFYNLPAFLHNPLILLEVWKGGMAFHGGLIGVLVAMALYARKLGTGFFQVTDFIAPLVPLGLFSGRLGNFINAELWGGPSQFGLGMRVPCDKNLSTMDLCQRVGHSDGFSVAVHPNQLYEATLEGIVLFLLLLFFSAKSPPRRAVSGLFLLGYGTFRFAIEFVRMPDAHLGYLAFGWVTMGQLLTIPMIVFGVVLLVLAYRSREAV